MTISVRIEEREHGDGAGGYRVGWIGDLEASGDDTATATAAVEQRARRALTGGYAPLLLHAPFTDLIALIWRDPYHGWSYMIYNTGQRQRAPLRVVPAVRVTGLPGFGTAGAAERAARDDLAKDVYVEHRRRCEPPNTGAASGPESDAELVGFHLLLAGDTTARRGYARWVGFQRAWQEAARRGALDPYRWAGVLAAAYTPPLPDPAAPLPTHLSAAEALTAIRRLLDGQQWSPDTLDEIARLVRATGRQIHDLDDLDNALDNALDAAAGEDDPGAEDEPPTAGP